MALYGSLSAWLYLPAPAATTRSGSPTANSSTTATAPPTATRTPASPTNPPRRPPARVSCTAATDHGQPANGWAWANPRPPTTTCRRDPAPRDLPALRPDRGGPARRTAQEPLPATRAGDHRPRRGDLELRPGTQSAGRRRGDYPRCARRRARAYARR